MKCPQCGGECERDEVDNGVCLEPCGPWGCFECYWTEERITLIDDEEEELTARRASGQCICTLCNRDYLHHPMSEHLSHDGEPYLHRLCDGSLVKL